MSELEFPTLVNTLTDALEEEASAVQTQNESQAQGSVSSVSQLSEQDVNTSSSVNPLDSRKVSSRQEDFEDVNIKPSGALRLGTQGYLQGEGIWAGFDGDVVKFFFGDPSGSHVKFDGTTVSLPSTTVSALHIPDENTTANSFHVETDGDTFWGCTHNDFTSNNDNAAAYVLKNGFAKFQNTVVKGQVTANITATADELIESGHAVSLVAGTGNIVRTKVTNFSSSNSTTSSSDTGTPRTETKVRFLNISSTVKLLCYVADDGGGTAIPRVARVVVDPTTSAVTSVTLTTITSASGSATLDIDAIQISSTAVVITYVRGGTVFAKVLSGLDSGVTQNTELNAATSDTVAISYVSATEIILFYYVAATEVRSQKVTISGTTLSSSTTSTIYSTATTQFVNAARQYGTSSAYFISFSESTTNFRGIVGTYASGTFTMGSAVAVESFDCKVASAESVDDDRVICHYVRRSNGATSARIMSRSGTTLTSNSAFSGITIGSGASIGTLAKISKYTYVVAGVDSTDDYILQLLQVSSNSISQLGSNFTVNSGLNDEVLAAVYHSPTRILCTQQQTGTDRTTFTIDMTNNHSQFIGIAPAQIAVSASGTVVTHGPTAGLTGLTTGTIYYTDVDGTYTTNSTGARIGFSSSSSAVIVRT